MLATWSQSNLHLAVYSVRGLRRAGVVLQCAFPDAGHRELDSRYHRVFREYVLAEERGSRLIVSGQLRRLWQRRVACGG